MKKRYSLFILTVFFLLMSACKGGEDNVVIPAGIIPPDTMKPLLVDIHLVEAAIQQKKELKQDVTGITVDYYTLIFDKYHINRKRWADAQEFYSLHPKLYREMYDEVMSELSKKQGESMH
jgi:hypothetical protein